MVVVTLVAAAIVLSGRWRRAAVNEIRYNGLLDTFISCLDFLFLLVDFTFVALGSGSVVLQLAVGLRVADEPGGALGRHAREEVVYLSIWYCIVLLCMFV